MRHMQNDEQIDNSPPYTEFWMDVGRALDIRGSEIVNRRTIRIAHNIADLLKLSGYPVEVKDHILPIDYMTPIFGSMAKHMYELHEHFQSL
jgi:hypothetical protein